jgi:pimeloyl-ACP methyl ester carboxylesterase
LISVLMCVLLVPLTGGLYEAYARNRDRSLFHPPGRFVAVNQRNVHVLCAGSGLPTIVFESSGFGNSLSSREARTKLSKLTSVCSYDRMGLGWSDPGPSLITTGMLSTDLAALTQNASIQPPLIVVASSIGGLTAELFARQRPERVVGLVFLDAATSEMFPRLVPLVESTNFGLACAAARVAGRFGLIRMLDPFGLRKPAHANLQSNALMYGAQPWNTLCAMVRGFADTRLQFESAPALPRSMAVTALSAESTTNLAPPGFDAWASLAKSAIDEGLRAISERSTQGQWHVVPRSDHLIAESVPAAVVDAVTSMLATVGHP